MSKLRETRYEALFDDSIRPVPLWNSWAWNVTRQRTTNYIVHSIGERQRILIIGVGSGGSLRNARVPREHCVQKVGIDIKKKGLLESREYCDPILASASHLPLKGDSFDFVLFEQVLHHLKGQKNLEIALKEAHRTLVNGGKLVAIEPNSLNPSGFLMNIVNTFHLFWVLFGGSNYEFALSPREIRILLSDFCSIDIRALSFLHPRLPLSSQLWILKNERILMKRFSYFAWMLAITAIKS